MRLSLFALVTAVVMPAFGQDFFDQQPGDQALVAISARAPEAAYPRVAKLARVQGIVQYNVALKEG